MKKKLHFSTVLAICLCVAFIGSAQAAYMDKTTSARPVSHLLQKPVTCHR